MPLAVYPRVPNARRVDVTCLTSTTRTFRVPGVDEILCATALRAVQRTAIMHYLFCKHRVEDYTKWRAVFESHAEARQEAGLHPLHVLRDVGDPKSVVMFFKVDDLEKARAFIQTPSASEAAKCSGVIGTPEVLFLSE